VGSPTEQRAIEVPVDSLPPVDEHAVEVAAGINRTWEALAATLTRSFDTRRARRGARILGCTYTEARGEPSAIGSTIPGFVVARSVRPATLALLGRHRFSTYALIFYIDELGPGSSRLRAETRAAFPGTKGSVYRALVIGSRAHVRGVRRMLNAVRDRAGSSAARIDRPQLQAWVAAYERAWRSAGTDSLRDLFTEDATYSTAPYERPLLGLEAIARMWEAERSGPEEVFEMSSEIVAIEGDTGVLRIEVRYGPPKKQEYRDLWIVRLGGEGHCTHFEEWPFWPPGTKGQTAQGGGG
jgi:ketosteroid isomerase-like protein